MSEKKERKLTPKWFLHKTTTKAANSALAFITAHRDFLTMGELASKTSPILAKLDNKELFPTPALNQIKQAVLDHMIALEANKFEQAIEKAQNDEAQGKKSKPFVAQILNAKMELCTRLKDNGEIEELQKEFDLPQEAQRWCDRRLVEGAPDWHATIDDARTGTHEYILRNESIQRTFRKKKGPTMHPRKMTTDKLSFGVRAKQDRASFSHG